MALRLGKCRAPSFEYRSSKERGFESHPAHHFLPFFELCSDRSRRTIHLSLFIRLVTATGKFLPRFARSEGSGSGLATAT